MGMAAVDPAARPTACPHGPDAAARARPRRTRPGVSRRAPAVFRRLELHPERDHQRDAAELHQPRRLADVRDRPDQHQPGRLYADRRLRDRHPGDALWRAVLALPAAVRPDRGRLRRADRGGDPAPARGLLRDDHAQPDRSGPARFPQRRRLHARRRRHRRHPATGRDLGLRHHRGARLRRRRQPVVLLPRCRSSDPRPARGLAHPHLAPRLGVPLDAPERGSRREHRHQRRQVSHPGLCGLLRVRRPGRCVLRRLPAKHLSQHL